MQRALTVLAVTTLALSLSLGAVAPAHAGFQFGKLFGMSKSKEKTVAEEMLAEFEKDPGLIKKGKQYDLVQRVGKRIVRENDLDEYDYKFFLVKQDEVNAFATPAGYIYVTRGLVDYMGYDESMLAAVMAHELGHAKDRHVAKGYEKAMKGNVGLGVLGILLGDKGQDTVNVLGTVGGVALLKYNRDQEEWADRHGVELTYNAGYDAYGMVRGLQLLQKLYGSPNDIAVWMQNHPATKDRVKRTERIAADVSGRSHGYVAIPKPKKDHPLYELYGQGQPPASGDVVSTSEEGSSSESYSR